MALLRQILATILVLALGLVVALWAFETPGRVILAYRDALPRPVVTAVEAVARGGHDRIAPTTPASPGTLQQTLVITDPAVADMTRDRLRVIGTGQALASVPVHPKATGLVQEINFRSGDLVEKGQTLAVLQNDTETVAVDRARIAREAADDQLTRYQSLLRSGSITAVQFDEVKRAADSAALDLRAAEIALNDRRIIAPISGRVGLLTIEPGTLVSSATLVATVDDRSRLKILIELPEAFVPQVRLEQAITATPTIRNGKTYDGMITALDNRIDATSRTLQAEATVDNPQDDLRPGMSFAVEIAFPGQEYLSVDALAIQWERAGPFVWSVRQGKAHKVRIAIIERNVDRVLVSSAELSAGQPIVTEGVQQLREGAPVRIHNPALLPEVPAEPGSVPTVDRDGRADRDRADAAPDTETRLVKATQSGARMQ